MRGDARLARAFADQLSQLPHVMLITLDHLLAQQAAEAAAQHRLRDSDAVYAAVALRCGAVLVTLDREQHERVTAVLTSYYPLEALATLGAP